MASITAKAIPQNAVTERVSHIAGTRIFTVLSRTPGKEYTVTINETVRCTCPRARKACWHKEQVGAYMVAQEEARIQAEEDAKLQAAVGAWWQAQYGNLTAQEVMDAEAEREEAAFWADFNASRDLIISAVNVWIDGYLPKEKPMECKKCGRRCNGETGLCCSCEQEQRKVEAQRKSAACASWENDLGAYRAYRAYLEATARRYTIVATDDASLFEAYEDGAAIPDGERYIDFVARIEALVEVSRRHALTGATRKAQTCTRMAAHVTDDKAFSIFKS